METLSGINICKVQTLTVIEIFLREIHRQEETQMQMGNDWKRFECSGKIEDYLSYKGLERSMYETADSRRSIGVAGCKSDYRERSGNAGNHRSDGDDLKTITHG